jgi:PAS domain S-box-containing protein
MNPATRRRTRKGTGTANAAPGGRTPASPFRTREWIDAALEGSDVCVFDADLAAGTAQLSAGWTAMLGREPQETRASLSGLLRLVHPEDLAGAQKVYGDVLQGLVPDLRVQHRMRGKDGEWKWILVQGRVTARDRAGRALRVCGTCTDVTQLQSAQESARASEARLRSLRGEVLEQRSFESQLLEAIPSPVFYKDAQGRYLGCNRSYELFFGISRTDVAGKTVHDLAPRERVDQHVERDRRLIERAGTEVYEAQARNAAGAMRDVVFSKAAFRRVDGSVAGLVGVILDVTERKRAAEGLRKVEAELRLIMDSVPALIARIGKDLRFRYVNRPHAEFLERDPADIVGRSLEEVVEPAGLASVMPQVRRALAGEHVNFERSRRQTDGSLRWLALNYIPDRDAAGEVVGYYGLHLDVTDARRAQDALAESEERFRRLTGISSDWTWEQDAEFRFTAISGGLETAGFDRETILGKTRWELPGVPPPSDWRSHRALLAAHQPFSDYEYCMRDRQGVLRWSSVSGEPMFGPDGAFQGYRGTSRDITERKRFEEALRLKERELRLIMNSVPALITHTDRAGRFLFVNHAMARMYGMPAESIVGRTRAEILSPEQYEEVRPYVERALTGQQVSYEREHRRPDGSVRSLALNLVPEFNAEHRVAGLFGMHTDITERKAAEQEVRKLNRELELRVAARTEELSRANRELEAFSYSVSHDLRAPLRAIGGFAGMLEQRHAAQLPEEGRRLLRVVSDSVHRMEVLIDRLLEFARLSHAELVRENLDPSQLVREALEELAAQREGREVDIELGPLPPCFADRVLLRQVFANLLANALKYTATRARARIEIGAFAEGAATVYCVRDNGVGFDMQHAQRLFGAFERLHPGPQFDGTGVGLSMVRRIVERHGGRVWAHAEVERGARFCFTLGG